MANFTAKDLSYKLLKKSYLAVGDGGRAYGDRLPQLEAAPNDAGVTLGSLELSTEG